jgi:hypothetical protein
MSRLDRLLREFTSAATAIFGSLSPVEFHYCDWKSEHAP